jgi:hypothetical protein
MRWTAIPERENDPGGIPRIEGEILADIAALISFETLVSQIESGTTPPALDRQGSHRPQSWGPASIPKSIPAPKIRAI